MSNHKELYAPRVGLFGGSFDPFHLAHKKLVATAISDYKLDQLIIIPCGQPTQKSKLQASGEQRIAMAHLSSQDIAKASVSDIEIKRMTPSYTIDTLGVLCEPNVDYFWILGADQLNNFCTWKNWSQILDKVDLIVAKRPEHVLTPPDQLIAYLDQKHKKLNFLEMTEMAISATQIRLLRQEGQSIDQLVTPEVAQYIVDQQLYL